MKESLNSLHYSFFHNSMPCYLHIPISSHCVFLLYFFMIPLHSHSLHAKIASEGFERPEGNTNNTVIVWTRPGDFMTGDNIPKEAS